MQYFIPPDISSMKFSFLHGSYFILSWISFHSPLAAVSCNILFLLAFISIKISFLPGSYIILSGFFFHSPLSAVSCNISFLLAFISIYIYLFSFYHGSYFTIPWILSHAPGSYFMQYFIPLACISINFHFFMAVTSSSLGFCLIPPGGSFMQYFISSGFYFNLVFIPLWQLLHAIFHSFWLLLQFYFHLFMVITSSSLGFCLIPLP